MLYIPASSIDNFWNDKVLTKGKKPNVDILPLTIMFKYAPLNPIEII